MYGNKTRTLEAKIREIPQDGPLALIVCRIDRFKDNCPPWKAEEIVSLKEAVEIRKKIGYPEKPAGWEEVFDPEAPGVPSQPWTDEDNKRARIVLRQG